MSLSKLESLSNEILNDIIENYINGLDVLIAFNHQLNQRFNALISQCQLVRFDFIQCRKNDFRFCLNLLPNYIDKIVELAISDENTPGQVYAFLSSFPSFENFKRLHTLYFHFNDETIDATTVERALNSLSNTTIHTLSIKIMNTTNRLSLTNIIGNLFRLKSLKRFSFVSNEKLMHWNYLLNTSSNIEYLTISRIQCEFYHLRYIMQCAPHLKYLNVHIINDRHFQSNIRPFRFPRIEKRPQMNIILMSALQTLFLSFEEKSSITTDMLIQYFHSMPVLNRLEIIAHKELLAANAWEMLLESSLPLLTHFSLRSTTSRVKKADLDEILASFQSPYWVAKKNFDIMITEHQYLYSNTHFLDKIIYQNQCEFDRPVIQCWIAPNRIFNKDLLQVNKNISLRLCGMDWMVYCPYYFNNAKYLIVDDMNSSVFKWMTSHVNCSHITELDITRSEQESDVLNSFLACVIRMKSLHIRFDQLIDNRDAFIRLDNCVKQLDISCCEHEFNENDIIIIANCFPCLEHLKVRTPDLENVPMLKKYLLHLCTLTFVLAKKGYDLNAMFSRNIWHRRLQEAKFSFHFKESSVSIWMDHITFQKHYWEIWCGKSLLPMDASVLTVVSDIPAITETFDNNKK